MQFKTTLLGGAALSCMLVLGAIAPAQAKTTAAEAARMQMLEGQVRMLTERLNAQEAAQAQIQAQAQQAQAAAEAAQAQTASTVEKIPAQVQTAVAALPKPKAGWEANTAITGRMYANVSNIEHESDGVKLPDSGVSTDVKRFYVGIDHKFSDVYSANVTTDFSYVSNDGLTQVYLKKAYLQAKYSDALVVRLGAADLPWVPFAEDVYGYRYIENTVADRTKFGTSADWGVHASGKFADGLVNYAVSIVNGAGYKVLQRSEGMDVEGRLNLNYNHFILGVGGRTGKLGKEFEGVTTFHTANRFNALAAYKADRFTVGVEYFKANDWNNVLSPVSDSSDGVSAFASYKINDKVSAFGRYDWVSPNKDTNPDLKENYFNLGLSYMPTKIVEFALVYKRDSADNGFISTSNGTIGGLVDGTYDELGLWTQLRW